MSISDSYDVKVVVSRCLSPTSMSMFIKELVLHPSKRDAGWLE